MTLEDCEIRVRLRADQSSPELALAKYLSSKDTLYPPKDMVMIALMAYWLPLAHKYKTGIADEECIRSCIYRLKLHQQYLEGMLGSEVVSEDLNESEPKKVEIQDNCNSLHDSGKWENPLG